MWPFNKREQRDQYFGIQGVQNLLPADYIGRSGVAKPHISSDAALRHSAAWAAIRLRADLISTLPLDVYRYDNAIQVQAPGAQIFENIGGDQVSLEEWLYSSQVELDRSGNSIGLKREFDPKTHYPTRIQLQPTNLCSVLVDQDSNELTGYRIRGKDYGIDEVWHEKQYTVSGLHVGLSPVAYAAWQLGQYQSIEEFASTWFGNAGIPRVSLKNTEKTMNTKESEIVAETWRASVAGDKPFISGKDWELKFLNAEAASADWLEAQQFSVVEIARFFGVPANLIDGAVSGQSVTYSNTVSKNLDFLTLHLGPAITRREKALSRLLPRPRFVKFNTDAILRLDPKTRGDLMDTQLRNHSITVTEARSLDNRPPLTDAQMGEVMAHFPPKASAAGSSDQLAA